MRIGYVVQQFPPEVGAGPARVLELAQRWRRYGADVTIVTAMPSRMVPGQRAGVLSPEYRRQLFLRERWHELDVLRSWCYSSPKGGSFRVLANNASFMLSSLLHGLLQMPATDVLIASSPPFFPHITGRILSSVRRTPLVLEVRDLWPDYLVGMGVLRRGSLVTRCLFDLERSLLLAAERIVAVTDTFRERLVDKGVDPDRVAVIPNGVDLKQYRGLPRDGMAERSEPFTVGYLGNVGLGQDLTIMVHAAAMLRDEDVHFVLIGDGPDRRRVEAAAKVERLDNLVIEDAIPKNRTEASYQSFDICFVPLAPIPELQDTIPSKIFEMMACERPVLASASGETKRLVERAGCGLAVPPGNAAAVADAVRAFRAMPVEHRQAMGARGRAYVAQHYSRDLLARRYFDLLTEITNPQPLRAPATALADSRRQ